MLSFSRLFKPASSSLACSCRLSSSLPTRQTPPPTSSSIRRRTDLDSRKLRYLNSITDLSAFDPTLDIHPSKSFSPTKLSPSNKHPIHITLLNDNPNQPDYVQPAPPPSLLESLPGEDDSVSHLAAVTDLTPGEIRALVRFPLIVKRVVNMKSKGKMPSMYALVVVGNQNGLVGVGEGKDETAQRAVTKAFNQAVRSMDWVDRYEDRTVWGTMDANFGSCNIQMRSRPPDPDWHDEHRREPKVLARAPNQRESVAHSNRHRRSTTPIYLILITTFSLAAIGAVGHHLFNSHLHNAPVSTIHDPRFISAVGIHWDHSIPWTHGQRDATLVGLFLSHLIKVLLSTAVGVAFVQLAWRTVSRKAMSLEGVDAVFAAAVDPLAFLKWELWKAAWGTAAVAIVLWSMFVVTLLPVGSLTTKQVQISTTRIYDVNSFDANAAASLWSGQPIPFGVSSGNVYGIPTPPLDRIALSTLVSGTPTSPSSPCGNCSYTQQLYAPALNCVNGLPAGVNNSGLPLVDMAFTSRIWDAASYYSGNWTPAAPDCFAGICVPDIPLTYGNQLAIRYYSSLTGLEGNVSCEMSNASYTVFSNFTTVPSTATVLSMELQDWWNLTALYSDAQKQDMPGWNGLDLLADTATDDTKALINYKAIRDSLFRQLNGTIELSHEGIDNVGIPAISILFNGSTWVADMPAALQGVMSNITLSLLATPINSTTQVNATLLDSQVVFSYNPKELYIPYIYAFATSLVACLFGALAIHANHFTAGATFKTFIDAASNHSMRDPEVLGGKARIKYVEVPESEGGRYAFVKQSDEPMESRPESLLSAPASALALHLQYWTLVFSSHLKIKRQQSLPKS
ncbi:hypothetical protein P7C70_g3054, partial [Phenoliferia sp. Uapishka_3]